MRLRNVKNKKEIMDNSKYLIKDYSKYKGRWNTYFKNSNPIYIEIGMGKGKFIIENAKKYPDINFIGIEKSDSIMAKALQKIPEGLDNLAMIRENADIIDEIFDKEITHLYLNFSDPWPKSRHHLRRLTSKIFLDKYDNIFKSDRVIEMRTDNNNLFEYSLVSLSNHGYVFDKVSLDLHSEEIPEVTTEYEDKFSRDGDTINYLYAVKSVKKRK